jgi:hypothetical protein
LINFGLGKLPRPADLERGDLLCCCQPVNRPLSDLREIGDLLDGEDLSVAGTYDMV